MEKHAGDIIVDAGREQRSRRQSRDPDGTDPLFQHALLCQLGLPRRHVKERVFERRSGAASLLLEAGRWYTGLNWEPQPLPYGTRPRIVLINLCAEAVRTRSRTVNVEHSVRAFLRRLNIDTSGYSMRGFKRQMIALSCCHMQLGFRTQRGVGQIDSKPISRFEAWVSDEERQRGLWPGELELSADFYESLIEHAVPLEAGALSHLQNSAMALDVYCWLAHRLCRVDHPAGIVLSWWVLKEQFGQEFADVREFRRSFLEAMQKAIAVYQDARLEVVRGGLKLLPSPAPIKKTRVGLPPSNIRDAARKCAVKSTPSKGPDIVCELPLLPETIGTVQTLCKGWTAQQLWARSPFVKSTSRYNIDDMFKKWAWNFYLSSPRASASAPVVRSEVEQVRLRSETLTAARTLARGHDIDWLVDKFTEWAKGEGRAPRNPDAAFLAWVPSFLNRKR